MKKLISAFILSLFTTSASAHGYNSYYGYDWVAPLIIGGMGGYLIGQSRATPPQTIVIQPNQPIVVQPSQVLPPAPIGYYYDNLYDLRCSCYRLVLVPR